MVKVNFLNIPAGLESHFWKSLQPSDRYLYSSLQSKPLFTSRKKKKGMTQKSLLPEIANLWNELTTGEQAIWNTCAEYTGLNGYRLFTQDTCYRLAHSIEGIADPSIYHQHKVGKIEIASPATSILLMQTHPASYYVSRKIRGTISQYQPVKITENFGLPLMLSISYKSNLTVVGENPSAKFYADVVSSYQGADTHQLCEIDFELVHDWQTVTASLSSILGYFIGYTLFIDLVDLQGTLEFDNIKSEHTSQNYARDPHCNNIDTTFTKSFYQIPKHWISINPHIGAYHDSIYPED